MTLFNSSEKVFARLERSRTGDQTLYCIVNDLRARIPLSVLLAISLPQEMKKRITDIVLVGDETLVGKLVQHVAARTNDLDFQAWITTTDPAVPLRIVLTYTHATGQPQFTANLSDWNFHPTIDPSAFTFVPPAGAESVAFMVPDTSNAGSRVRR